MLRPTDRAWKARRAPNAPRASDVLQAGDACSVPSGCRAPRATATAIVSGLVATTALAVPAAGQELPTLAPEDYGRWESVTSPRVSPFGDWVAWGLARNDESEELHLRRLDPDTTIVVPWGEAPTFSPDGRWAVWHVGSSPEERDGADGPPRLGVELMDLETGARRSLGWARAFDFDATGGFLALYAYPPGDPEDRGGDVRLLDLGSGTEITLPAVGAARWSPEGSLFATTLATGTDEANAVQLYDATAGVLRGLDASGSRYTGLAWQEDGSALAVLRSDSAASRADSSSYTLLAWRDPAGPAGRIELASDAAQIPDSLMIVPHRTPRWWAGGARLELGLRPRPEWGREVAPDSARESDSPSDATTVQIWHASDVRIIPMQQVRASADARRTLLTVWEPEADRVVVAGTDLLANAQVVADGGWAVERTDAPYPWGAKFGRPYRDVWAVDLRDGTRERLAERVRYEWTSLDRPLMVWYDGTDYWLRDLEGGDDRNLTAGLGATFANTEWDTPTDGLLPPHGMGGWEEDGAAVYLYDRFDVWRVPLDGSMGARLTEGADEEVVHRIQRLDFDDPAHAGGEPVLFQLRGEWTEARGWARWSPDEGYERLLFEDRSHWFLQKADSVDRLVFRSESREESPDLILTNGEFGDRRTVAETNPFQSEYAWTRSELVDYTDGDGNRQHGVLLYPANHDPSRRYPMIVYAYEILSPQRHFWENPSERDYYNFTTWTQQGYFVLLPDIVFRGRDPGVSMAEAVGAAIEAVNDRGLIDREGVGFVGHSWGGYHATYLAARTNLFAATVAGAPLTDFVSFMGQIHWNPGIPEPDHWETGQARMEVPYWEDPEAHHRNSPIHGVHEMTTPLLMAHGSDDGVVEFFQATEFYNFARRAERPMVLLVYEGEDHSFRQKANQIDYHRRILEWFGHHLKREPAPAWIREGVAWDQHAEERARVAREAGGDAGGSDPGASGRAGGPGGPR